MLCHIGLQRGPFAAVLTPLCLATLATQNDFSCIFDACDTNHFFAEYFASSDLSGSAALTQCEDSATHDWSLDGSHPLGGSGPFSARWHGSFEFAAGEYRFTTVSDDGSRLYVDGDLVLDRMGQCCRGTSDPIELSAGEHFVTFEFIETGGHAYSDLHWERESVHMCLFNDLAFSLDGTNHVDVPYAMTGFPSSGSFSVSLIMTVNEGPTGAWRNVLHVGVENGQRTPAIWLNPSTMGLHARVTTQANGNAGIGSSRIEVEVGVPTHVTYVMDGTHLSLYVNGVLSDEFDDGTPAVVVEESLYLGADPWYAGFAGSVQSVCLMSAPLSAEDVMTKYSADVANEGVLAEHYGRCVFGKSGPEFDGVDGIIMPYSTSQFPDGDGSFAVSFVIRVDQPFTGGYRNVLHVGTDNNHRSPAIWLSPSTNTFLVVVSTEGNQNYYATLSDPQWEIQMGEEIHCVYVMDGTTLSFYINGELALTLDNGTPAVIYQDPLYIGDDPWYEGFRGAMHSLCLHDDPLSAPEVRSLYAHDTTTHDYLLIESAMPWSAARSECLALGRDLASVHGSAENDELGRVMGDSHVWIGATDASCPGTVNECWGWSDGSGWEYTNWRGGEPNGPAEDCGELYVTGGDHGDGNMWNDAPCGNSYEVVCGRPVAPSPPPSPGSGH